MTVLLPTGICSGAFKLTRMLQHCYT